MPQDLHAHRIELVDTLSGAFLSEAARADPAGAIGWERWPTVGDLLRHVGEVYAWVTEVLTSGEKVELEHGSAASDGDAVTEFADRRTALLAALRELDPDRPCWTLDRDEPRTGFWARRMVFETLRHLADLRDAGRRAWEAPTELAPEDWADGIDEFLEVFLARARKRLDVLPGVVALEATDGRWRWTIDAGWDVAHGGDRADATVAATAADLALLLWERADPFDEPERFHREGDDAVLNALVAAPIHV
ncbi:MAG: maleylpyruvate isomerase N-terminal domain-containing protein [Actinomycetales bacterium]|nr:maleylpyruvate isomerase N-terminal domain-containing protein [Actinomycetales bacterium]